MSQATNHLYKRMSQRGISKKIVNCVINFGDISQDKYVITQTMANEYILAIQKELRRRNH
ncbi:DUF4258 domain-containing protein [Glaesserella parasuis]|nr:DUF4258 domain-containing protein [Glaesserella parasuis]MDE3970420.1 DUF4258 domain-containing protein [Glaesserella parasuis]MDE3982351.1 DUF4258 domain-containing protein [Glaesserella parasuis]MDE3991298.1 DUF4258 domain-containing protein [Glaesserella parasuis]